MHVRMLVFASFPASPLLAMGSVSKHKEKANQVAPQINDMIEALEVGEGHQIQSLGAKLKTMILGDGLGYNLKSTTRRWASIQRTAMVRCSRRSTCTS